ncbi:ribosomal L28 family-domain-containing protein [Lasiosphaeria ovina]|uniref:Large ribosomal subunit protein bL28m n=1 Tax=Lasiosphaeria ovina TaxID=92902 RepID=A0AAE0N4Z8_9PEZI|nr:ribosomal L28 family-domain-containing protein [Lasiosphaeria ovina]
MASSLLSLGPCLRSSALTTSTTAAPGTSAGRALFSTTSSALRRYGDGRNDKGWRKQKVYGSTLPLPSATAAELTIPPYPYGPNAVYRQSNAGLYGGQRIQFGNNVSEKHGVKTRRDWRVNVQRHSLFSAGLGQMVRVRTTTRVLRTVDKVGGLDAYLLGIKAARLKELGPYGWRLRWRLMQSPRIAQQYEDQRLALGLPARGLPASALAELEMMGKKAAAEQLLGETDAMLANGDEFAIGEDLELLGEAEAEVPAGNGFMHEEPADKSQSLRPE